MTSIAKDSNRAQPSEISQMVSPVGTHIYTLEFMPIRGVLYGPEFVAIKVTLISRQGIQVGKIIPEIVHLTVWSANSVFNGAPLALEVDQEKLNAPLKTGQTYPGDPACKGPIAEAVFELTRTQLKTLTGAKTIRIGGNQTWLALTENHRKGLFDLTSRLEPEPFAGTLAKGMTYQAIMSYRSGIGWWPVEELKILPHHAAQFEWTNSKEYPGADQPEKGSRLYRATFRVESIDVVKVTAGRWNTTYRCTLLEFGASIDSRD